MAFCLGFQASDRFNPDFHLFNIIGQFITGQFNTGICNRRRISIENVLNAQQPAQPFVGIGFPIPFKVTFHIAHDADVRVETPPFHIRDDRAGAVFNPLQIQGR